MFFKYKYLIAFALLSLTSVSCLQYLTTPPVGSLPGEGYYTTPAHVEQGVRGVYSCLRGVEARQYMLLSEDRSDNVWVDPAPNGIRGCSEISYFRFGSSLSELKGLWSGWYSLINNANTVLAEIDNVEFSDEKIRDQFKGELLFLRGLAHFELARNFGNVPVIEKLYTVSEIKTIRQTKAVDVINNSVLPDLKEADRLLPYEDGMKSASGSAIADQGRANKIAAKALLARVYMTLKGFPFNDVNAASEAKTYLEAVLKYSSDNGDKYWAPNIDEWKKQWMTDPNISNKYQIFAIQHRVNTGNPMTSNEGVPITGEYLQHGGNGSDESPVYPEASLWYEYTRNNDPRGLDLAFLDGYDAYGATPTYSNIKLDITLEDGSTTEAYEKSINVKYCPYHQKREPLGIVFDDSLLGGWPLNFPILRLEDMQLLYAELLVEEGNVEAAMKYVNNIRERAGIPLVPDSPGAEDAMEYIKRERKLEFYLEGIRWYDQVRYGEWKETTIEKFDRYKRDGEYRKGVSPSNVYGERYFLPIPFDEMAAVPGLYEQNKDWN